MSHHRPNAQPTPAAPAIKSKWTADRRIQFGILLAAIAYGAVSAALWWTTYEGIHSGQRAYLTVSGFRLEQDPAVGQILKFAYNIKNTGQTPAQGVSMQERAQIKKGLQFEFKLPPSDLGDLGAGETHHMTGGITPALGELEVDAITRDGFSLDKAGHATFNVNVPRFVIFGVIKYRDVFNHSGKTEFCAVYLPPQVHVKGEPEFIGCADRRNVVE